MKKIFLLLIVILTAGTLHAQHSAVDRLFEHYSGAEGFTTVSISKAMFEMLARLDTTSADQKELKQTITNLTGIRILAVEDPAKVPEGFNLYKEVMKDVRNLPYEELMVVREDGKDVKFLVQKNGKKISELLLLVGGPQENVAISIQGDIDLKNIAGLSKMMNISGMEELDNVKE